MTRLNQRALATSGAWVKNGDQWIVTAIQDDGSMRVRRPTGGGVADLPPGYVREHVELGYATTAHRAQGRTVDTAHAFVTATTVREPLYVMATRGQESNRLYVDTRYDPDAATSHEETLEAQPVDVLRQVLAHSGADTSATETRQNELANADNPTRFEAEGTAIHALTREERYTNLLLGAGVSLDDIETAKNADHWGQLLTKMQQAERSGVNLERALAHDRLRASGSTGESLVRIGEALEQHALQAEQLRIRSGRPDHAAIAAPAAGRPPQPSL